MFIDGRDGGSSALNEVVAADHEEGHLGFDELAQRSAEIALVQ
jgi:hypothetical protein